MSIYPGSMITNPIDPLFYVWNLSHNVHAIMSGSSILDTNMFYPETNTLAYSDHLFAQTLQVFPLFLIIKNPLFIQNTYILSTFIIAGFGMFLLMRYVLKTSNWISYIASLMSGLLYAFSYFHIDHFGQVPTVSIQWIPLSFLYLLKSYETKKTKHLVLFYLFFTLNFLSTMYYGIFLSVAIAVFFLMKVRAWEYIKRFALIGLPFLIILGISLYPYLRFHFENPTIVRTLEESSWRSAHLADYVSRTAPHDRTLYLGIVPLLLVIAYCCVKKKSQSWLLFVFIGAISIILSLGPEQYGMKLPYYFVYKLIPIFQSIRVPSRFGVMAIFSVSALAGLAFFSFLSYIKKPRWQIIAAAIIMVTAAIDYIHLSTFVTVPTLSEAPAVYRWLAEQPDDVVIVELPLKSGANSNHIEDQVYKTYDQITENDNFVAETFRLYFSTLHWKRMVNGYSSYFPPTYSELAAVMENFPSPKTIDYIKKRKIGYLLINKNQYGIRWSSIEKSLQILPNLTLKQTYADINVYQVN